ncbi:hypothetical protein DFQ26_008561 [Actinomortierella ambigua]|nr:hypothetical protein DFQ26_008561 [Actinomortierella ambigua]
MASTKTSAAAGGGAGAIAKAKKLCIVCQTNEFKYKCPTCSLACYKIHKESPCEKPAPEPESVINVPPVKPVPDYLAEEPVTLLSHEQLERIEQSTKVKEMLQHEGLRKLIHMIDSSENPEFLLDKARQENHLFVEFADEILAIVDRAPGQTGREHVLEAMGMGSDL